MNDIDGKKVYVHERMTEEEQKIALETALFMGFHTESAHFPIAEVKEEKATYLSLEKLLELHQNTDTQRPSGYVSATESAKPIPDFDWRKKKGLETLFCEGIFLNDEDKDLLPDKLSFKIAVPKKSDTSVMIAACNFAFRFGMETTAYYGSIAASEGYEGNLLVFESGSSCSMRLEDTDGYSVVHVEGEGEELVKFSSFVCENFPLLTDCKTWTDQLQYITESFAMRNLDGQMAYLKAFKPELQGKISAFVSPEIQNETSAVTKEFPEVEFHNYKGMKKVYEKTYDIPWEVDIFEQLLEKEVYPNIKAGDRISIYGALSEEKDVRGSLEDRIKQKLMEKDASPEEVQLVCAYKQGISWIEEAVLPKIKKAGVKKVRIEFKPFLPEGITEWQDENGATPSYNNIDRDNPDNWYDKPIRFLQELYPVEDIISEGLGIERNQIEFAAYEGTEDITYLFRAFDEGNKELNAEKYKVSYTERPFLDEYPEMGKVHPSTGYLKVISNGNIILERRVATDVENIWDVYQRKVLPECRKFIERKLNGRLSASKQPFFARLKLEVNASEPNYRLKSREDIISSLDALHEDMYFVGTDYFKNYGIKTTGEVFDAPGLILPVIKKAEGKPSFKVTLYDQIADEPYICTETSIIRKMAEREQVSAYIDSVSYENEKLNISIHVDGVKAAIVKAYAELIDRKVLGISRRFKGINKVVFDTCEGAYSACIQDKKEVVKDINIADIDISEHKLIGYDQYMEIIEKFKRVPGLAVYKIADSYMGREIYAIELLPKESGYVSRTKRITNHPSEVIICRHHANEVSSTNAAFMLLKELLSSDDYRNLPDKLNLVIMPMENVDGSAIHYELQKDNPNWKFHVARFNAIGKEFYYESFKEDTIHTEALGLKWLWRTFLPDVIVDNHGVPSHEWEQQFSGYTSPSFKGFWLPRSLLYGYFWTVTNEEYKSNYPVNKQLEDVIADAIGSDEEMVSWNNEWTERFEKFAHSWMPKLFPTNYYKGMINYWIPFEYDSEHRYPSIRFPWITTVAYTSEVADETAQGEYLNLCARAHVKHDIATIKMLMNCKCIYRKSFSNDKKSVSASCVRQRPIVV